MARCTNKNEDDETMKPIVMGALVLLAMGCGGGNVTLSTRVGAPVSQANALVVADGVDVTRVRMVLREIELKFGDDTAQEVEFEITESAVMEDIKYCTTFIQRLRDRGYRVSIDDFGTGHSSLSYLKILPANALKIDQAFVQGLTHDANDQKIVRTILDLARSLDLETIAEGVEEEKTLALLRDWGQRGRRALQKSHRSFDPP
jgi:predicted signal transduction protein with EAL and GGDEF domain